MIKIYGLYDPETDEIRYIGKTSRTLDKRLMQHLAPCNLKERTHKINWIKSLMKKGLTPKIKLLKETTINLWKAEEKKEIQYWMGKGANLTNGTKGGEGLPPYYTSSEETRRKISRALKGVKKTKEHNLKVALSHTGKIQTERAKDIASQFHRKLSDGEIKIVKKLSAQGILQKEICKMYSINRKTLYRILYNKMRYSIPFSPR